MRLPAAGAADRPAAPWLWHEPIAVWLRHQDLCLRGIAFDLLAQPVDVGLEGVRRHAGIVAPDLAEQRVPPDHPIARPIEIFQDRGLLLGQPDLAAGLLVDQQLAARPEAVGPDGEDGTFA